MRNVVGGDFHAQRLRELLFVSLLRFGGCLVGRDARTVGLERKQQQFVFGSNELLR